MRIIIGLAAWLLAGCATQLATPPQAQDGAGGKVLAFQRNGLNPHNGGQLVAASVLRPGDILLTAARSLSSTGIQLFTTAPVSHAALYIGDGEVAEAVGEGVRTRSVEAVLADEDIVVALRHPRIGDAHAERMQGFARDQMGRRYNYLGVVLQAPFSLERRLCELPAVPTPVRDACIQGIATLQLGTGDDDRFFCSQFVLEAYRVAGLPMTRAEPGWLSPADILHMREGDVSSVRIEQPLTYVGHLKYRPLLQVPAAVLN